MGSLRDSPLDGFQVRTRPIGGATSTLVALACEITAWSPMLAFTDHPARRWEPKRLRLRIFSIPAQLARFARATVLRLPERAPWAALLVDGLAKLRALPAPG